MKEIVAKSEHAQILCTRLGILRRHQVFLAPELAGIIDQFLIVTPPGKAKLNTCHRYLANGTAYL
jgi:hypothetical protein